MLASTNEKGVAMQYVWFFLLGVFITFYMVTMGTLCSAAAEGEDAELTSNECLGAWFVATALMITPPGTSCLDGAVQYRGSMHHSGCCSGSHD